MLEFSKKDKKIFREMDNLGKLVDITLPPPIYYDHSNV